jgi:hypothetical protein
MGEKSRGTSGRTAAKISTLQASYRVNTSIEGLCIPILYGRNRLQPNIFFAWSWVPQGNWTEPPGQGGKGGLFGTPKQGGSIQYTYSMWMLLGLCEGPLLAIGRLWQDKGRGYQFSAYDLAPGGRPQPPGAGAAGMIPLQALSYFGTAYMGTQYPVDLGSNNSTPNFSYEGYGPLPYIQPKSVAGESISLPPPQTSSTSMNLPPGDTDPVLNQTLGYGMPLPEGNIVLTPLVLTLIPSGFELEPGTPLIQDPWQYYGSPPAGHYWVYGDPTLIPGATFTFCPTDSGTVVFSFTYAPATYQVAAQCLGTCTEEYTLPDDNPITVVNDDLWAGDAGVTLAGVPLTPIPYSQPNPIYPPVVPQGCYTVSTPASFQGSDIEYAGSTLGGTYWFSPLDRSVNYGDLIIKYEVNTPAGATVSPSGSQWTKDNGVAYEGAGPLTPVSGTPDAAGKYNVVGGFYTFSGWDSGATILIDYSYNILLDSNPADFLPDLLCNPYYGAGFDPAKIGDMSQFSDYCLANDFLMSPLFSEQEEAREQVADILKLVNSQVLWSEDVLKFLPMGDQVITGIKTGVTFTPDLRPVVDLNEDDLLAEDKDKDPIQITRNPQADAYNQVRLEFMDRFTDYNTSIVPANNQAAQDAYGLRPLDVIEAHQIVDPDVALLVATNILQYCLYARNTYQFKLGLIANILEPGDWITLTSPRLGLDHMPLRVTSVSEDDKLVSSVEALEWPIGTAQAARYRFPARRPQYVNYNASPGNCNAPIIFEPPLGLSDGLELWVAVSGGPNWGGCQAYVSLDGSTYRKVGTINPARTGSLINPLPASPDPDLTDTLAVDLSESRGVLLSASQAAADALATLCYLGGELIAYRDAQLVSTSKYDLSYLRRNCYGYGGVGGSAHTSGERFARLDNSIFKFPFGIGQIGQTIYLKFLSYNTVGAGGQSLLDVEAYPYQIQGSALTSALPDISGLVALYQNNQQYLKWSAITPAQDPRYSSINYEIRLGASWASAQILGYVSDPEFLVTQPGTYWVSAHYASGGVTLAYSAVPAEIVVSGALAFNSLVTRDEATESWPGTLTGVQVVSSVGLILAVGQPSGYYTIPAGEIPDLGAAQAAVLGGSVAFNNMVPGPSFDAAPDVDAIPDVDQYGAGAGGQFDQVPDVDALPDFDQGGGVLAQTAQIQVQFSQDGSTWGPWQSFIPGSYVFRKVNFRLALFQATQGNATLSPVVTDFAWSVEMPDRIIQVASVSCPATGLAVTFTPAFQVTPAITVLILNAQAGDVVTFPVAIGASGGTIEVQNSGVGVTRNISYVANGY